MLLTGLPYLTNKVEYSTNDDFPLMKYVLLGIGTLVLLFLLFSWSLIAYEKLFLIPKGKMFSRSKDDSFFKIVPHDS
jgi:hypothetical protein